MLDLLQHLFACVCGQNPNHSWLPGGVLLPCCQRCTGLYVGAFMAAVWHLALRPAPTNRWLWLNGGCLLFMVPFGFHWLPQDPLLRTMTGVLFGFGLVGFLWLPLGRAGSPRSGANAETVAARRAGGCAPHLAGLLFTLTFVPWLGANGNSFVAYLLALLAALGAFALFGLVLANAVLALGWLMRRSSNRPARAVA